MPKNILIIEDEKSIQNILKAFLEDAGYAVALADDGMDGIAFFHKAAYDLVLLDVMMPRLDGYSVCEMIRNESTTPIILLTALDDEDSQLKGFDLLADDYITKPFSMPLVLKRIEAVLWRSQGAESNPDVLSIQLDTKNYQVFMSGQEVVLTAREFEILRLFMENPGRVFSREQLLDIIWNYDYMGDDKIINTHIKNIRKKLGVDCIETIRGVGYGLSKRRRKEDMQAIDRALLVSLSLTNAVEEVPVEVVKEVPAPDMAELQMKYNALRQMCQDLVRQPVLNK